MPQTSISFQDNISSSRHLRYPRTYYQLYPFLDGANLSKRCYKLLLCSSLISGTSTPERIIKQKQHSTIISEPLFFLSKNDLLTKLKDFSVAQDLSIFRIKCISKRIPCKIQIWWWTLRQAQWSEQDTERPMPMSWFHLCEGSTIARSTKSKSDGGVTRGWGQGEICTY